MIFRFVQISGNGFIFQGRRIIYFISLQIIYICHSWKLEANVLVFDFTQCDFTQINVEHKNILNCLLCLPLRDLIVR